MKKLITKIKIFLSSKENILIIFVILLLISSIYQGYIIDELTRKTSRIDDNVDELNYDFWYFEGKLENMESKLEDIESKTDSIEWMVWDLY